MAVCFPISLFVSEGGKEFAYRCVHPMPGQVTLMLLGSGIQVRKKKQRVVDGKRLIIPYKNSSINIKGGGVIVCHQCYQISQ
jgi:hypothetical protein